MPSSAKSLQHGVAKLLWFLCIALLTYSTYSCSKVKPRVLVFSKTAGYRHASIPAGREAIAKLSAEHKFSVDFTEDAAYFAEDSLKRYSAVIFLNTTGDVLDHRQQADFERFIQAGGGYVGIHSASDTEYDWPWYGRLCGAYFDSHPKIQEADLQVVDHQHPATDSLPDLWKRTDEWYNLRDIKQDLKVLVKIDEKSYEGGKNGDTHPMSWYHEYDGGRAFYTAMGHTSESYQEPLYLKHLWGGIQYAMGKKVKLDNKKARTLRVPDDNRFSKVVLDENLNEPMEMDFLPDGNILFIERRGAMKVYDTKTQQTTQVAELDVFTELEDGLLGLALDPDYNVNHWIYLFYSPPGPEHKQHVSRFEYFKGKLNLESEKVVLVIPNQRDECCHSAGCLEFGPDGLLYISVGDNTNPFASSGYAPIDESPGRSAWDAQKSSGNANDFRGKILRIKPKSDGTYTIPDGNLFPKDGSKGKPEIYVMGNRNPYRTAIDPKTNYLYWGEVGPDAGEDGENRGPRGYDEVNQAKTAGFFGWPYFIGDNKPYYDYNFALKKSGQLFDPQHPINNSSNNTGIQDLPPAQPAMVWYPYGDSPDFPHVGRGGRNAMAGPVYYADMYADSETRLPDYYDGKFFMYDWMRNWILAVTFDEKGNYEKLEPFLSHLKFDKIIDMVLSPDGELYMLEYGTTWFAHNPDARLIKIEYESGNRKPQAVINADKTAGAVPLTVQVSADSSLDFDGDAITYSWSTSEKEETGITSAQTSFTFTTPGDHFITLTVTDKEGKQGTATLKVIAGNEPPTVKIDIAGNSMFYWDNSSIDYEVKVSDTEDGSLAAKSISPKSVRFTIDYLENSEDLTLIAQGHMQDPLPANLANGRALMNESDCKACHVVDSKSVGPSYIDISKRYEKDPKAVSILGGKIIKGGGGNWGETAMAAHPQFNKSEAESMAAYILSLGKPVEFPPGPPLKSKYAFPAKPQTNGVYVFMASYRDKGGNRASSATSRDMVKLAYPSFQAEEYDEAGMGILRAEMEDHQGGALVGILFTPGVVHIGFNEIDLTGVRRVQISVVANKKDMTGGLLEIHADAVDGTLLGTVEIRAEQEGNIPKEVWCAIKPLNGKHKLFLVNRQANKGVDKAFFVDRFYLSNQAAEQ
jgi:cytochrome c